MESFRDEKFTTRHKRHNPIPHSWLSSCGKIEIPHSRLRRSWGISISPRLLSHSWGIGISLLWLVVNFQFLHLRLRRSCRNYPVPETFHKWIGSFPNGSLQRTLGKEYLPIVDAAAVPAPVRAVPATASAKIKVWKKIKYLLIRLFIQEVYFLICTKIALKSNLAYP